MGSGRGFVLPLTKAALTFLWECPGEERFILREMLSHFAPEDIQVDALRSASCCRFIEVEDGERKSLRDTSGVNRPASVPTALVGV